MKFGFELEAFVLLGDAPQLVPHDLPMDECGWLAEIRSEPHIDPVKAMYLLKAERQLVETKAKALGLSLAYVPLLHIPRKMKVEAARSHGKGQIYFQNVYGHQCHKNSNALSTASLHVSVTNEQTFHHVDAKGLSQKFRYQGFVDHAKIIATFDREFKAEITKAKRNPGFYEHKPDGRIEYRSLPNDVDLDKVVEVLLKVMV